MESFHLEVQVSSTGTLPMELLVFNYYNSNGIIPPQSLIKVHCSSTPLELMEFIQCNYSGVIPLGSLSARDYNAILWNVLDFI
jgi:hypothetical protein